MKTVIPLAGKDLRFEKLGVYKPLIMIGDKPLIYRVVASNGFSLENLYFVVLYEHEQKYEVSRKLKKYFGSSATIAITNKICEGAPNSILETKDLIDDDEDILIDLGDIIRDLPNLKKDISSHPIYSGIVPIDRTFVNDVWGYTISKGGIVSELREKSLVKIKGGATMGLYYFSSGKEFIQYATEMIVKNQRVNYTGMFYVGPVYNQYIADGKTIGLSYATIRHALGSPDQIDWYIRHQQKNHR